MAEAFGMIKDKAEQASKAQEQHKEKLSDHDRQIREVARVMKEVGVITYTQVIEKLGQKQKALETLNAVYDDATKRKLPEYQKAAETLRKEIEQLGEAAKKASGELSDQPGAPPTKWQNFKQGAGESYQSAMQHQQEGLMQSVRRVSGSLPVVGGLFGLMIYGRAQASEVTAEGARLRDVFDNVVGGASGGLGKLSAEMRDLQVRMVAAPADYQAAVKELVDSGMKESDVRANVNRGWAEVGSSVAKATVQLDKWLNLGAGTSAREIGRIMRENNKTKDEAISQYERLGAAAKQSGGSVLGFLSTVQQAQQQLKMFGADATDVAGLLLSLEGAGKGMGLGTQANAEMSRRAAGGIAGALGGMDMGMQSIVGERMFASQGLTGLDARAEFQRRMKMGVGRRDGDFESMIQAVRGIAKEGAGPNETDQALFLEKVYGMSFESAQMFMRLGNQLQNGLALSDKDKKELAGEFKSEAQKTNDFLRSLKELQEGMRLLGMGLLDAVVLGFAGVVAGLNALIQWNDKAAQASFEEIAVLQQSSMSDIETALTKHLPEAMKDFGNGAAGPRMLQGFKALARGIKGDADAPKPTEEAIDAGTVSGVAAAMRVYGSGGDISSAVMAGITSYLRGIGGTMGEDGSFTFNFNQQVTLPGVAPAIGAQQQRAAARAQ
jgi:hypothetical protein